MKSYLLTWETGPSRVIRADRYVMQDGWVHFCTESFWGLTKVASYKFKDVSSIRECDAAAN